MNKKYILPTFDVVAVRNNIAIMSGNEPTETPTTPPGEPGQLTVSARKLYV